MVQGSDGNEYGPVDVITMKSWVTEGRINQQTQVRDFSTGMTMEAGRIDGLFQPTATPSSPIQPMPSMHQQSVPYSAYPQMSHAEDPGKAELVGVIWRSAVAVVLFFFLHGIGLIFAGYAVYFAIQCKSKGSKYGTLALIIAGLAFAAVAFGWIIRLTQPNSNL